MKKTLTETVAKAFNCNHTIATEIAIESAKSGNLNPLFDFLDKGSNKKAEREESMTISRFILKNNELRRLDFATVYTVIVELIEQGLLVWGVTDVD